MSAFPSTRWSLVQNAAAGDGPSAADSLAQLCQIYRYPVYVYVRARGHSHHDAEDLTQEFFQQFLESQAVARVDRVKGRFRNYLLTCVNGVLSHERERQHAEKRGGKTETISFDAEADENRYKLEPVDHLSPDKLFDRAWAMMMLETARGRLEAEYRTAKKGQLYQALQPVLQGAKAPVGLAAIATAHGKTEEAVKMEVSRMRRRYREIIGAEVCETLLNPADGENELQHLLQILTGTG